MPVTVTPVPASGNTPNQGRQTWNTNDTALASAFNAHEALTNSAHGGIPVRLETLANLRALAGAQLTGYVGVMGGSVAGDGQGGLYFWDSSSTAADDGTLVIIPNSNPSTGRWRRLRDGWLLSEITNHEALTNSAHGGIPVRIETISALRALAGVQLSGYVGVMGSVTAGDGQGGIYFWDSASTATDDNYAVIIPNSNPSTGRWRLFAPAAGGIAVDSVSSLRALNGAQLTGYVTTRGVNSPGGGGSGIWRADPTPALNFTGTFVSGGANNTFVSATPHSFKSGDHVIGYQSLITPGANIALSDYYVIVVDQYTVQLTRSYPAAISYNPASISAPIVYARTGNIRLNFADNTGTVVIPNSAPPDFRWKRMTEGQEINAAWFNLAGNSTGYGVGTDDAASLQNFAAACQGRRGFIPPTYVGGTLAGYRLLSSVYVPPNSYIRLHPDTVMRQDTINIPVFWVTDAPGCLIEGGEYRYDGPLLQAGTWAASVWGTKANTFFSAVATNSPNTTVRNIRVVGLYVGVSAWPWDSVAQSAGNDYWLKNLTIENIDFSNCCFAVVCSSLDGLTIKNLRGNIQQWMRADLRSITITGTATASGNAVITADSVTYTVPITNGDTATTVAAKLRNAANYSPSITAWTLSGAGNVAIFTTADSAVKTGTYSISLPAGLSGVWGSNRGTPAHTIYISGDPTRTLNLSGTATASGTATITIDSVVYTVSVSSGQTAATVAANLGNVANYSPLLTTWSASASGASVGYVPLDSNPHTGTYAVSLPAGLSGSWTPSSGGWSRGVNINGVYQSGTTGYAVLKPNYIDGGVIDNIYCWNSKGLLGTGQCENVHFGTMVTDNDYSDYTSPTSDTYGNVIMGPAALLNTGPVIDLVGSTVPIQPLANMTFDNIVINLAGGNAGGQMLRLYGQNCVFKRIVLNDNAGGNGIAGSSITLDGNSNTIENLIYRNAGPGRMPSGVFQFVPTAVNCTLRNPDIQNGTIGVYFANGQSGCSLEDYDPEKIVVDSPSTSTPPVSVPAQTNPFAIRPRDSRKTYTVASGGSVSWNAADQITAAFNVTTTSAITLTKPANAGFPQVLRVEILNSTGSSMGTLTWDAAFKLTSTWTNPTNGNKTIITFVGDGTNYWEASRNSQISGLTVGTQIDTYTTAGSYTWTKPANAQVVYAWIMGGGGGGGSGRRGATGTVRCGGGGGGGAGRSFAIIPASLLGSTVSVVVGAGGVGGAAVTTDDTNGNAGNAGGVSRLGANTTPFILQANNGSGGAGGTASTGTGGGAGGALSFGGAGASASTTGAVGAVGTSSTSGAGHGGASGGGITSANATSAGGPGAQGFGSAQTVATAGAADGGTGADGQAASSGYGLPGGGGAGGGSSATTAGGAGGKGGAYGSGGGGGGASLDGFNSGAGGNGADGFVMLVTHF